MAGVFFVYRLRTWTLVAFLLGSLLALGSSAALADCPQPTNCAPPTNAILDLGGLPDTGTLSTYSVTFMAAVDDTTITFAFRDDPGFLEFSSASLVNVTPGSGNLLQNGDFSPSLSLGWTYTNLDGVAFGGYARNNCVGSSSCWWDGAIQGYDTLSQMVALTPGDSYTLSFDVLDVLPGGPPNWSAFSTNGDTADSGGNGVDVLAYATGVPGENIGGPPPPPPTVPEVSTWAMMLMGFAGLGYLGYRRRPMHHSPN
jgi:hypothetical protein